ncbi:Superkiller protein 3 [Nowakowskiella sp. JEL0078]|nr:Superkiller protein 3 [Nowakowskiella sp. JEL0078]
MSTQKVLKEIRAAIGKQQFEIAKEKCLSLLESAQDYHAFVFLGFAELSLENFLASEKAYKSAILINPEEKLAYQGLLKAYEDQGNSELIQTTLMSLRDIYAKSDDVKKLVETLLKILKNSENISGKIPIIDALWGFTDDTTWFEKIKDQDGVLTPVNAWNRMAQLQEEHDNEEIKKEVDIRRTRLSNDTPEQIKRDVEKLIIEKSQLETMLAKVLTLEPTLEIQDKYVDYLNRKLGYIEQEQAKLKMVAKLLQTVKDLVEKGTLAQKPYEIYLDTLDSIADDYDVEFIENIHEKFVETRFATLLKCFTDWKKLGAKPEVVAVLIKTFEQDSNSLFEYHIAARIFLDAKEYNIAIDYSKVANSLLKSTESKFCVNLPRVNQSLSTISANAYLNIGGMKNFQKALDIFKSILTLNSSDFIALQGLGRTLAGLEKFNEAKRCFEKLKEFYPDNLEASAEIGWVHSLQGENGIAKSILEDSVNEMRIKSAPSSILALHMYRLGVIFWNLEGILIDFSTSFLTNVILDKAAAYKSWIQSVKLDTSLLSSFTYLGHYYLEVENDRERALKCYQRAVNGSVNEQEAMQSLIKMYIEDGDSFAATELVEAVLASDNRCAWAWRQFGFIKMAAANFLEASTCFQNSLRSESTDILAWEGLADTYFEEGKYMASIKAFTHIIQIITALKSDESNQCQLLSSLIYVHYKLGDIKKRIGIFTEAINDYNIALGLSFFFSSSDVDVNLSSVLEDCIIHQHQGYHAATLLGLSELKLAFSQELFQSGAFGRSASMLVEGAENAFDAVVGFRTNKLILGDDFKIKASVGSLKVLGDSLAMIRILPSHARFFSSEFLKNILRVLDSLSVQVPAFYPEIKDSECRYFITQAKPKDQMNIQSVLFVAGCVYRASIAIARKNITEEHSEVVSSIWSNISICYFERSRCSDSKDSGNEDDQLIVAAIKCLRVALQSRSFDDALWNAMGVLAVASKKIHPAVAQHAFIKAIEHNPKSSAAWSNLGFLYLRENDKELAEKAFAFARSVDPENSIPWLGSAIILENNTTDEPRNTYERSSGAAASMRDMIEHAYELSAGSVAEVNLRYAISTFERITQSQISIKDDPSLLNASVFCMLKFVERHPNDFSAFNFLGLIFEKQSQYERALESFNTSLSLFENTKESTQLAWVTENKARVLCALGFYPESADVYEKAIGFISDKFSGSINLYVGSGLALYFSGQLEKSLQRFETALKLTEVTHKTNVAADKKAEIETRSQVTIFVAQVLFALGSPTHIELAKRELLRCVQTDPTNVKPMLALCSLGLNQSDLTLAQSAAVELLKALTSGNGISLEDEENIVNVLSAFFLAQGNGAKVAKGIVSRIIRRRPWVAKRWAQLAEMLMKNASIDAKMVVSLSQASLSILPISGSGNIKGDKENITTKKYAKVQMLLGLSTLAAGPSSHPSFIQPTTVDKPSDESSSGSKKENISLNKKSPVKNYASNFYNSRKETRSALSKAVHACPGDLLAWSALAWSVRAEVSVDAVDASTNTDVDSDEHVNSEDNTAIDLSLPEIVLSHTPKLLKRNWWHTIRRTTARCDTLAKLGIYIHNKAQQDAEIADKFSPPTISESIKGRNLRFLATWSKLLHADVTSLSAGLLALRETTSPQLNKLQTVYTSTESILAHCLTQLNTPNQHQEVLNETRRIASAAYAVLGRSLIRMHVLSPSPTMRDNALKAFQQALTLQPDWLGGWLEFFDVYAFLGTRENQPAYMVEAQNCIQHAIAVATSTANTSTTSESLRGEIFQRLKLAVMLKIAIYPDSGLNVINEVVAEATKVESASIRNGKAEDTVDPKSSNILAAAKLVQGFALLKVGLVEGKIGNSNHALRASKIFQALISSDDSKPGMIGSSIPWANLGLGILAGSAEDGIGGVKLKDVLGGLNAKEYFRRENEVQPGNYFVKDALES